MLQKRRAHGKLGIAENDGWMGLALLGLHWAVMRLGVKVNKKNGPSDKEDVVGNILQISVRCSTIEINPL